VNHYLASRLTPVQSVHRKVEDTCPISALTRHVVDNRTRLSACVTRYLVLVKSAAGPLHVVLITALQDVFQEGPLELGGDEGN
jgi:hypothetical protein